MDHLQHRRIEIGLQRVQWCGVLLQTGQRRLGVAGTHERNLAGQAFVQNETQRVHIGRRSEFVAQNLLGRQVLRGAHHDVLVGEILIAAQCLGDAEIGQHHPTVLGEQDVAGLHVAMDDARTMRGVEGRAHGHPDVNRQFEAERPLLVEGLAQRLAVDELHDHGLASVVLDRVVNGHHVGVVQTGCHQGLASEPLRHRPLGGQVGLEQFHRHRAIEGQVGGLPDVGHSTVCAVLVESIATGDDGVRSRRRVVRRIRHGYAMTLVVTVSRLGECRSVKRTISSRKKPRRSCRVRRAHRRPRRSRRPGSLPNTPRAVGRGTHRRRRNRRATRSAD